MLLTRLIAKFRKFDFKQPKGVYVLVLGGGYCSQLDGGNCGGTFLVYVADNGRWLFTTCFLCYYCDTCM